MKTITIAGRLGQDAETKDIGGSTVVNFSVAVRHWTKDDPDGTMWFACAWWGQRGERLAPYLRKGSPVTVSGEFGVREYDRNDGSRGYSLEIRVNDVTPQGSKGDESNGGSASASTSRQPDRMSPPPPMDAPGGGFSDDEIPF